MEEFPPNSRKSKTKTRPPEEKNVEQITSGKVIRRKKSLRKQFTETFVGGDAKTAMHYVVFGVLIPAAKDALAEAGATGIEKLIYGDSKRGSRSRPSSGPTGYVSYNRMSMSRRDRDEEPSRAISRRGRSQHNFEEIVLSSRSEAEEVIDRLFDIVSRYNTATVADLYELVGVNSNHTDQKWGWDELHGSDVTRVRNGYLLDLPEPEPLG